MEKIRALLHGHSKEQQIPRLNELLVLHDALLDKLVNNTGRPKGKKPGLWPCQCHDEIKLLMGVENFNEIFNDVAEYETCLDRRSKLTLNAANKNFHSLSPRIQAEVIERFRQNRADILACRKALEQAAKQGK